MKTKHLSIILLGFLLIMTGCQNDDFAVEVNKKVKGAYSLVATIEGHDAVSSTRTAVSENGAVTWIETDELGVFAENTQNAKFTTTSKGGSATFSGILSAKDEAAQWAYYPYQEDATFSGNTLTLTLPSEYQYTGNSNAPMIAVSQDGNGNFQFKHLCGLLRITLGGGIPDNADRFVITSIGDNALPIAGTATVSDVMADNATLSLTGEGSKTITYTLGSIDKNESFQSFFVPLPVGTYKLQVAFYLKDQSTAEFTRTLSNLIVSRAAMTSMPILDWKTGEQFVLSENTTEITADLAEYVEPKDDNNTALVYKSTVANELPKEGEIVYSRVTEDFPYGFLGKVTSVTQNSDGTYTVETKPVALSEAFDELYVDETVTLASEDSGSPTTRLDPRTETFGFNYDYELGLKVGTEGETIYAEGGIKLGFQFQATFYFDKKNKIEQSAFTLITDCEQQYGISADGTFVGDDNLVNQKLGTLKFKSIPIAYGIIQLTPALSPYFIVKAEGKIKNEAHFKSLVRHYAGLEYKDGKVNAGTTKRNLSQSESPWTFGGSLSFQGELGVGLSEACEVLLYNRDDMKISIAPELTVSLGGDITIDETNSTSLEKILNSLKLTTACKGGGKISLDASLLSSSQSMKAELNLTPYIFWEKELYLAPFFADLFANPQLDNEGSSLMAEIATEATGELMAETNISIEVEDEKGEVVQTSEPITYKGSPKEDMVYSGEEAPVSAPVTISNVFDELSTTDTYNAYPVIESPILKDILPEGKIKLKDMAVTFKAPGSLRDQLIQLYKDTDGDNWTNNENWCSDMPVQTWQGIDYDQETGLYTINLSNNNLNGALSLSSAEIDNIDVFRNPSLTSINVSGCTNLEYINYDKESLTLLDISGCTSLADAGIYLDEEYSKLKTFKASGSNLEDVSITLDGLEVLDLSNCPNLIGVGTVNLTTLRSLNLSGSKSAYCDAASILEKNPIEILDISGVDSWNSSILYPATMKELYVNDCPTVTAIYPAESDNTSLQHLEARNCESLTLVSADKGPYIDVSGCTALETLNCGGGYDESTKMSLNLNFTGCTSLKTLAIVNTNLTTLNLDELTQLTWLNCSNNELTQLDVNQCAELVHLDCNGNKLEELYASSCPKLEELDCSNNQLNKLTMGRCSYLKEISCDRNKLTQLDVKEFTGLEELICYNNSIASLVVSNNTKLKKLVCDDCDIQELDVTRNANLEDLSCSKCDIKELNLTNNVNLTSLDCDAFYYGETSQAGLGSLTSLDVSNCAKLVSFSCRGQQLAALDVSNLSALENLDCGYNLLTSLNVAGCSSLKYIDCENNQLTSLDVKSCSQLEQFHCEDNQITSIDISGKSQLSRLFLPSSLKELNASGCTSLSNVNSVFWGFDTDVIEVMNLQGCSGLEEIYFDSAPQLTTLDISGCTGLTSINLNDSQISTLDISSSPLLTFVDCRNNASLATLVLSNSGYSNLKSLIVDGTIITSEIPDWLTISSFYYEQRYTDYVEHTDENGNTYYTWTDKGYGWWYPGEPDSGKHARQ